EDHVRNFTRHVLEKTGYTVLEARHGPEALEIIARHQGPIHLLLSDVVMPHMRGEEVARRICEARPGVKVLFMSGYTARDITPNAPSDEPSALLPKPFTPLALASRVRQVLDESG